MENGAKMAPKIIIIQYKNLKTKQIFSVKSKYVIGCDGANSFLRKQIKSEMEHLGFEQRWAVIDLILKNGTINIGDKYAVMSTEGPKSITIRNLIINNNRVNSVRASSAVKIIASNLIGNEYYT